MATTGNTDDGVAQDTSTRGFGGRVRDAVAAGVARVRGTADDPPDPSRRAFLRKTGAAGLVAAAGVAASSGEAAAVGETCDVSRTDDRHLPWNAGGDYGGWGGADYWGTGSGNAKTPVVFVHGNGGDACNYDEIAGHLRSSGWRGDDLWAISFREYTSDHAEMNRQLDDFVQHVLAETGASQVNLVGHSLGVTGIRYWLQEYDRYGWVDRFVGMAGANHGVCVCYGCYDHTLGGDYDGIMGAGEVCQFVAIQCFSVPGHPLYELNLPDETPGDVDYYMTRGIYDPLYGCNVFSPYLDGADNDYFWTDHMGQLEQTHEVEDRLSDDGDSWW